MSFFKRIGRVAALAAALGSFGLTPAADVFINANIAVSETWTADNTYILTDRIFVTNGATLTIEPGTVVRGEPASGGGASDVGALIISRGSKIRAIGTKLKPIVFTNLDDDNVGVEAGTAPYDTAGNALGITETWGGVILLGRSYVSNNTAAGPDAAAEVQIEGLDDFGDLSRYGNCDALAPAGIADCDDDDSGVMTYVSIRYGGFVIGAANEINGITLGGVGRGTLLDYIEIFQNKDDGVEFFGGTAEMKHLIVANVGDDGMDYDEGFRGKVQFALVLQGTPGADKGDKGGEHDGGNSPDSSQPLAIPTFHNTTLIGLGQKSTIPLATRSSNSGLHFRDNAGGRYYNSAFIDFGGAAVLMEGGSGGPATAGTSGERSQTGFANDGVCRIGGGACVQDSDCAVGDVCDGFWQGPDSTYQLELQDNVFQCIGRQERQALADLGRVGTMPTRGVCAVLGAGDSVTSSSGTACFVDGDCGAPEVCVDAPGLYTGGTDATKFHHDNGLFSNAALDNDYLSCASPLVIRQLTRQPVFDPSRPNPVIQFDPRPAPGSPLAVTDRVAPADGFFEPVAYKGAFDPDGDNWADGWTTLSRLGYFPARPQVMITGSITASDTWTADNEYILTDRIFVTNGATLTIEAGTVVRGEPASGGGASDVGALIVTRGSKIRSLGTRDRPVVFTDMNDDNVGNSRGVSTYSTAATALGTTEQWGGVIILGRTYVANNTAGGPDSSREVQIEGLDDFGALSRYGNCASFPGLFPDCFDDDSGKVTYTSIRYGGFVIGAANEINGLTLGAVGSNTVLDYIDIFQNKDDGVELFGGTASIKHLSVGNVGDDSLDYDEGWRGKAQFVFAMQGTPGADRSDKGGEHDGGNSPDSSQPYSLPAIFNATYVGLGQKSTIPLATRSSNSGVHFRDNAGGRYYNSAFLDFGGAPVLIEGGSSSGNSASTSGERAGTAYTIDGLNGFYRGPDTEFQLELRNNEFWCIGRQERQAIADLGRVGTLPTRGVCAVVDGNDHVTSSSGAGCGVNGDCVTPGETCVDSPGLYTGGTDATKYHFDNGLFTNPAFANSYSSCASALPIARLQRLPVFNPSQPDPVISIDPRPVQGGPLTILGASVPEDAFFDVAPYKGAFAPGSNWAAGWTTMARLGYFPEPGAVCPDPDVVPNEVSGLRFGQDHRTVSWQRQLGFDMNLQAYDLIRANSPDGFAAGAFVADDTDRLSVQDQAIPAANSAFFYAVRAENSCGTGSIGTGSDGVVRPAP